MGAAESLDLTGPGWRYQRTPRRGVGEFLLSADER